MKITLNVPKLHIQYNDSFFWTRCTAAITFRDVSFWQYKVYADIRKGSLERRHRTTLGSRAMPTGCGRMLKFIHCTRNRLARSSDIGF